MQWLPHDVVDILTARIDQLASDGFLTSRVELVCAILFCCDPSDADLVEDLRSYKARYRYSRPRRFQPRGVPLIVRMPSPITLRLDGLVRSISRRGQRIYRHELIGTLILRMEDQANQLEGRCLVYRQATAGEAAVPGEPKSWVLTQKKPRPGARSF